MRATAKAIIARITTKVKSILQERAEPREASLTVENAGMVVDGIQEAVFAGAAEGLKTVARGKRNAREHPRA